MLAIVGCFGLHRLFAELPSLHAASLVSRFAIAVLTPQGRLRSAAVSHRPSAASV